MFIFRSIFLAFCLFSAFLRAENSEELSHYVVVSVAPHKFFVERIAGDTVKVGLMVPAGASAHTFEPNLKEMMAASKADIWFQIGESFEAKAGGALKSYNSHMQFIDLRKDLSLISDHLCHHHHASCYDLHFWLSPTMAKTQSQTIADALIATYPENKETYQKNLQLFLQELDQLDQEIHKIVANAKNRVIMVSHPAYGYFCRDYNFKQLSIEFEGRDPTPQQLTKILTDARKAHIHTIFIQMQYNSKGAKLIAQELGTRVVTLDPYSEHYIKSMLEIAENFAAA